nr:hypothetical protein [Tanacetum cinerariifolium]
MSADSAVTYTSVHSEARSWSIPSEDPYEEAAQQLLKQAPCSLGYVHDPIELEDHVPLHIPKYPEDLLPVEDEAPIEAYIHEVASAPTPLLPPSFLSLRIRPPHTKEAMAQMRVAVPSTYHSLLPSGTPPLLPIPLPVLSTSRRTEITRLTRRLRRGYCLLLPDIDTIETRFQDTKRMMMTALEMVNMRVSYQKMAPKRTTRSTQVPPITPAPTATTTTITEAQLQALIDRGVADVMAEAEASRVRNGYGSNGSGPRLAQAVRECTYPDFLKYVIGYSRHFQELALMYDRMFPEEFESVEKYISGLPGTIHDSVKAAGQKQCKRQLNLPLN